MNLRAILLPLIIAAFVSCGTRRQNSDALAIRVDTIIVFSSHIKLTGQHSTEFGGTSFNPISIFSDNKLIFKDSTKEYWLTSNESTQYPKHLECADGNCQILIDVDERPNKNELVRLTITKDGKLTQDRLPIFIWNPLDIDNDKKLELEGVLTNGETTSNGDTAFYNPTLLYELTDSGLCLDSAATKEKNIKIWGQFYGYEYNEVFLLPILQK